MIKFTIFLKIISEPKHGEFTYANMIKNKNVIS